MIQSLDLIDYQIWFLKLYVKWLDIKVQHFFFWLVNNCFINIRGTRCTTLHIHVGDPSG